jgi:hypothetical protein
MCLGGSLDERSSRTRSRSVNPRRPDRCAMESDVRIGRQPVAHLGREVRAQVVHNTCISRLTYLAATVFKGEKLLGSTPWIAFSGNLIRRDVQRPEQIDDAMPNAVVCSLFCRTSWEATVEYGSVSALDFSSTHNPPQRKVETDTGPRCQRPGGDCSNCRRLVRR